MALQGLYGDKKAMHVQSTPGKGVPLQELYKAGLGKGIQKQWSCFGSLMRIPKVRSIFLET